MSRVNKFHSAVEILRRTARGHASVDRNKPAAGIVGFRKGCLVVVAILMRVISDIK